MASADIPADTVLFTIPRQSIICKDTSTLVTKLPSVFDESADPKDEADGDEDHDMDGGGSANGDREDDNAQDSWTTLILILIHEHLQGTASPWKPYLDVLPASSADFSTPMFWSPHELAELQASPVVSKVGRDEAEKMIRSKILPVVTAHEDLFYPATAPRLSEEDLVQLAFRMGSVIMAYAFDLEKDDDEAQQQQDEEDEDEWVEDREGTTMLGMVPMADILNADASFNAHIEHGDHALTATSLRPIARGQEILNYYGPLSNGELLRRYGYVTRAHRRWNLVDLTWQSVLAALKTELAGQLSDKDWEQVLGAFVAIVGDDEENVEVEEAESALEEGFVLDRGAEDPDSEGRVHDDDDDDDNDAPKKAAPPEDLLAQTKEVMKAVKKVKPDAVPDKTARDRAIYAAIAKALEARTKEYGTTLAQDLELYEKVKSSSPDTGALADRQMLALDVRIGEKVLLKEASEVAQAKLAELAAEAARGGDDKRSAKRRKM